MVYREGTEYLEVNLGAPHLVTKVEVQGRFGNGQGREFARQYKLQLWRPGLSHWVTYIDSRGQQVSYPWKKRVMPFKQSEEKCMSGRKLCDVVVYLCGLSYWVTYIDS
ncbi:Discoidin domain-containing receptor A [Portunus trituberculatus]|uniref:Discoidin domain-containing receptor A n=1 Tax=Portunus trituberculatus TaxID=210409 RepID=A0A5B7J198_PORTR|nr:Discoidin domain-containing receptor A [Portunus trituberculatus]